MGGEVRFRAEGACGWWQVERILKIGCSKSGVARLGPVTSYWTQVRRFGKNLWMEKARKIH